MKTSRTVKTVLRKDKIKMNGQCPLYFQIIFNSKVLKLPTGIALKSNDWDSKKCAPKGNVLLSKKLEKKEQDLRNFIDTCDLHGKTITKELIKEHYNGKDCKGDFYYHFDRFTKRKFEKIKEGTQNHYLLLRKQLLEFKPRILVMDINEKLFEDFFTHLKKKGIGNSGLATRRKNLITVLEFFKKENLIQENYCKNCIDSFEEKKKDVFLSKAEVIRIKNADLNIGSLSKGLNLL